MYCLLLVFCHKRLPNNVKYWPTCPDLSASTSFSASSYTLDLLQICIGTSGSPYIVHPSAPTPVDLPLDHWSVQVRAITTPQMTIIFSTLLLPASKLPLSPGPRLVAAVSKHPADKPLIQVSQYKPHSCHNSYWSGRHLRAVTTNLDRRSLAVWKTSSAQVSDALQGELTLIGTVGDFKIRFPVEKHQQRTRTYPLLPASNINWQGIHVSNQFGQSLLSYL